jgi:hypothetical protein
MVVRSPFPGVKLAPSSPSVDLGQHTVMGVLLVSSTPGRGTRIQGSLPVGVVAASLSPLVGGLTVAT